MSVLDECKKINETFHYFTALPSELIHGEGPLSGLHVSVKDCICVKGLESKANSRILEGYTPVFDATVVARLKDAGASIIGKTSQDAFGFGSFNSNVGKGYKIPINPVDGLRVTGGSSGGAAGVTAVASFQHVALAESTGGSIVNPAAYCGVVGYCPTYGLVSRYGLISYANSLDKIGLMAKRVEEILPVLKVISGPDEKDATCIQRDVNLDFSSQHWRVGVIRESLENISPQVKSAFDAKVEQIKAAGGSVVEISLPTVFEFGVPTYYILSMCESSTNLAKLSGLRYGKQGAVRGKSFGTYFENIRGEHFNEESKRRILLGTYARMAGYRDAFYIQAAKVRTLILQEYAKSFEGIDVLISPTMPNIAPTFEEVKTLDPLEVYQMDVLTVGPNLAGLPHGTLPIQDDGMPIGLMAIGEHLQDGRVLAFLNWVQNL